MARQQFVLTYLHINAATPDRLTAALLTMRRRAFDDSGRAIEHGTHIYAGSRYGFEVNLLSA